MIIIQIVAFGQWYGPFLTQTIAEIVYDQWSGCGRETKQSPPSQECFGSMDIFI